MPAANTRTNTPCRRRLIAIAGNPNSGKTTVFNALAGARQKVGNYPGVTVERKTGQFRLPSGEVVDIVDLPGCYSLAARSPEEQIAHDMLLGEKEGERRPDLVVVVVDASNLKRHLFLTSQLHDMGVRLIVALNMMDVASERGVKISPEKLALALGCPVVPLIARRGEGIGDLIAALDESTAGACVCGGVPRFVDRLPAALEPPVHALADGLIASGLADPETARAEALWLLVSTVEGDDAPRIPPAAVALVRRVRHEFRLSVKQVRAIETSARYRYLKEVMCREAWVEKDLPHRLTDRLDGVLLHRLAGPLIFIAVMALVFQSIFSWVTPAMTLIEGGVKSLTTLGETVLPEGLFRELVLQGVIAGVGNVLVFLPQILLLFLFIGLLEDIGYMARAAFIMDRLMARAGLDGRAFLPLLSSFACAVPGIMATRTIAGKRDRLVTILVAPLMSCSARLPVYVLVIGTVFAAEQPVLGVFTMGGLALLALYALSIVVGVTVAAILKRTLLRSPSPPLLLELPTYKLPSLKSVALNVYDRARLFVIRAGTVILAATVILWVLMHLPIGKLDTSQFDRERQTILADPSLDAGARTSALETIEHQQRARVTEQSLGGRVGRFIEPVLIPLGFDWRIGVGILASFAAREVFVSGLAVVHGVDEATSSLREHLRREVRAGTGEPLFTPLTAAALLVFFVLACQCVSTLAIARRETAGWRWPAFMIGYMTVLAWLGAFTVYQGGKLLGLG